MNIDRDPNERVVAGTIIAKETQAKYVGNGKSDNAVLQKILEGTIEAVGEVVARITIVGGIATVIVLDALKHDQTGNPPLTYAVRSTENRIYIVLSKYPGFSIGECVNLFISADMEAYPPRMASGGSC